MNSNNVCTQEHATRDDGSRAPLSPVGRALTDRSLQKRFSRRSNQNRPIE
jgi:hypothetical protein